MKVQAKPVSGILTKKRIITALIITNLITIGLLLNIHVNLQKVKQKRLMESRQQDTVSFRSNPAFVEQTGLFSLYPTKQANIVMLGSSFTQRVNWAELLQRNDVVNRGVGSDICAGYLYRLQAVMALQPKICFLEAGANDLMKPFALDTVYNQIAQIVDSLLHHHIHVVLTTCFYAGEAFTGYTSYNRRVDSLNARLSRLSQIDLIDLNPLLAENAKRKNKFCIADGIHFSAEAYAIWKKEIEKKLVALPDRNKAQ